MPKQKGKEKIRHDPLHQQIQNDFVVKPKNRQKVEQVEEEPEISTRVGKRILRQAQEQQDELEREEKIQSTQSIRLRAKKRTQFEESKSESDESQSEDELEEEEGEDIVKLEGEFVDEIEEITDEDQEALSLFMGFEPQKRTLADIIMEKIHEKERENQIDGLHERKMDPKVISVYTQIGDLLKRYTAGKVPKAFKIIPGLVNWEEIIFLTNPDGWSPQAMREATRIFASNLNPNMAQRFYNLILLPAVRNNISDYKKLNYHLYMALKKAIYKPAAFFKGIILPLCEEGNCALKEAAIIGSVLSKISIPRMHSSAALLKITQMEPSAANFIFIRILLQKKYDLPYRVVDALVDYFCQFRRENSMPVLWHQALLVFVQRYKADLAIEQKDQLRSLMGCLPHKQISAEARRELSSAPCRGEEPVDDVMAVTRGDFDVTPLKGIGESLVKNGAELQENGWGF